MDVLIVKNAALLSLIGTLGASFVIFYNETVISECVYALIGSIIMGATMFLLKKDGD